MTNTASTGAPVTVVVVGAGSRGSGYASWIAAHPQRATVVAVAEPRQPRRQRLADQHGLAADRRFASWREVAALGRIADAVLICTQDVDHLAPATAFAELGYHVLVEKPMSPSESDCRRLVAAVEDAGVIMAVAHVMRYMPYTEALREVITSGRIGDVVSVQHLEPVGWSHQAHSFVRGNWRREDESSFMLMAKSCHDIDWLRYVVGQPIARVASFGGLEHFRRERHPEGAGERCTDCAVEHVCAYSALRIYHGALDERGPGTWPVDVITDDHTHAGIDAALEEGPYGRCVYLCDNDVVDHQVVAIEFAGGATASFTMTAFTDNALRRTQVFGTRGWVDGDGLSLRLFDFLTATTTEIPVGVGGVDAGEGHAGGDAGLMDSFIAAVAAGDPSLIASGPAESLETHLAVFAAERSRRHGTVETVTTG